MTSWFCYDSAAEIYHSISVPLIFQRPAEDLITLLALSANETLLDVGAGTGAISAAANGAGVRRITAIDISPGMLKLAEVADKVVGALPDLPFADCTFAVITAGFVLTHLKDYAAALREIRRLIIPSGRFGTSAWKINQNRYSETWSRVAFDFAGKDYFSNAASEVLPWEDWFSDPQHLDDALKHAGFSNVRMMERSYQCSTTIEKYLASRQVSLQARCLRRLTGDQTWVRFQHRLLEVFRTRFNDPIEFTNIVIFAIAT